MDETVTAILGAIGPLMSGAAASPVSTTIGVLSQIVGIAVQSGPSIVAAVQTLINDVRSSGAPTADQLAALDAFDDQLDAAFEAAATAAGDPK